MKIITTAPIKHDGEDIEVGASLDLPERQAHALIEACAAELPAKKVKAEKDDEAK
jgi:hypothetical protein